MERRHYTSELKAKIVLEVLQGGRELGEIAAENHLNPNMVRNWKREFLENASLIFEDPRKAERKARKEEEAQRKETARMLKTIGQLTLERDFLQDCFRRSGRAILEYASWPTTPVSSKRRTATSAALLEAKAVNSSAALSATSTLSVRIT